MQHALGRRHDRVVVATEETAKGGRRKSRRPPLRARPERARISRYFTSRHSYEPSVVSGCSGGFPSTTAQLNDDSFLNATPEYFGGQEINKVLVDASENVVEGFEYLPFQVYANSVFADTVGQAYSNGTDLDAGLEAWQENLVTYGESQGFTITE